MLPATFRALIALFRDRGAGGNSRYLIGFPPHGGGDATRSLRTKLGLDNTT